MATPVEDVYATVSLWSRGPVFRAPNVLTSVLQLLLNDSYLPGKFPPPSPNYGRAMLTEAPRRCFGAGTLLARCGYDQEAGSPHHWGQCVGGRGGRAAGRTPEDC